MKFTSYLVAVSVLLSVSVYGQNCQEPHQSIGKINTNGRVSIDNVSFERRHLYRHRLCNRLNRRADPVEEVLPSNPVVSEKEGTFFRALKKK